MELDSIKKKVSFSAQEADRLGMEQKEYNKAREWGKKPIINVDYLKSWIDQVNHRANTSTGKITIPSLEKLLSPYLIEVENKLPQIRYTTLENFRNKFKITSNILDPMYEVWEKFGTSAVLAGGKLVDWFENKESSDSDFDVFFPGGKTIHTEFKADSTWTLISHLAYLREYEIQGKKFQFIDRAAGEPESVIEEFDIRACAICTDGEYIWWIKGALQDIRDKQIIYSNPSPSINHFLRIQKYINKGYSIKAPDFAIAAVKFLDKVVQMGFQENYGTLDRAKYAIFDRDYVHKRDEFNYDGFKHDEVVADWTVMSYKISDQLDGVENKSKSLGFSIQKKRETQGEFVFQPDMAVFETEDVEF